MHSIQSIVTGELPTKETIEDILWLTQKYEGDNYYYNALTSELPILHRLFHGIFADGEINDNEIIALNKRLKSTSTLPQPNLFATPKEH